MERKACLSPSCLEEPCKWSCIPPKKTKQNKRGAIIEMIIVSNREKETFNNTKHNT